MHINFMKVHQPNLPHPDYIGKSELKSKYGDSLHELDARVGRIMDKVRELGIGDNTLVIFTTDNGAWQDVYPDAGYTPFRGTKGTVREGGVRVPAIAWWPGKIEAVTKLFTRTTLSQPRIKIEMHGEKYEYKNCWSPIF
jgi:arylsulfatase A-like enzyme